MTDMIIIIYPDFQALVDINELMRTEKNTVRKRLLADPEPGEVTAGTSENGGGGPSVTYVTATGEIIDQRIVGEMQKIVCQQMQFSAEVYSHENCRTSSSI